MGRRAIHTRRYARQVPGHHIQVAVKFLNLKTPDNSRVRRFQYTAIDDATRVRALMIYRRHNQKNATDFIDYLIERFPFRIHTVRTDRGHEFQAQFHWHVEDKGMRHVYIKPRTPQLNGKVERSHRSDKEVFCPVCRHDAQSTEWNTPEQIEYIQSHTNRVIFLYRFRLTPPTS